MVSAYNRGSTGALVISLGLVSMLAIIATGLAIWAYQNYNTEKNTVDQQVQVAELNKEKEVSEKLNAEFIEREKQPNRKFTGPEDYGSLSFDYPKIWSLYNASDSKDGGEYESYFHPYTVPPVSNETQFALRVTIVESPYDSVVENYDDLVDEGELKANPVIVNGDVTGLRLDGNFTTNIRGSAVVFKLRDKTVTIRTDANTFLDDFNALIATVKFVK